MELDATFADFVSARWAALYRTAYVLTGSRHQAEDLLQEVLARTCTRWGSIRDRGAEEAYVRRAMVNLASRQWRQRDRERLVSDVPDAGVDGGIELRMEQLALWAQIRELPPRMRAVLVLRHLEQLSEQETADALGISVGSVKSHAHHALKRLRAAMPEREIEMERLP